MFEIVDRLEYNIPLADAAAVSVLQSKGSSTAKMMPDLPSLELTPYSKFNLF